MGRDPERELDRDLAAPEVRDAAEAGSRAPEANVSALNAGRSAATSRNWPDV